MKNSVNSFCVEHDCKNAKKLVKNQRSFQCQENWHWVVKLWHWMVDLGVGWLRIGVEQ